MSRCLNVQKCFPKSGIERIVKTFWRGTTTGSWSVDVGDQKRLRCEQNANVKNMSMSKAE